MNCSTFEGALNPFLKALSPFKEPFKGTAWSQDPTAEVRLKALEASRIQSLGAYYVLYYIRTITLNMRCVCVYVYVSLCIVCLSFMYYALDSCVCIYIYTYVHVHV